MAKASILSKATQEAIDGSVLATLTLYENGILKIEGQNDPAKKTESYCYFKDFIDRFTESTIKTGLMPPGTIGLSKQKDETYLLFCTPPHSRDIRFKPANLEVVYRVNLPYMLWHFTIRNGILDIDRTSIALTPVIPFNQTTCYRFPLGNTFDRGEICWGGTFSTKEYKSFKMNDIPLVIDRFFGSIFNGHIDKNAATNIQFLRDNSFNKFIDKFGSQYLVNDSHWSALMRHHE